MIKTYKSIVILFGMAILCAGFYFFVAKNIEAKESGTLFRLREKEQIASIELKNEYGVFSFEEQDGEWSVTSEETYRTNKKKMKLFLEALNNFAYSRQLEKDNGEYGLEKPAAMLRFDTSQDRTSHYSIGNMTASQNDVYIRDDTTKNIYVIPLESVVQFTGSLAAYRDNEVFTIDTTQIATMQYYKDNALQVTLGTTEENTWYMQYPYNQLARQVEMQEFMTMIQSWSIAGYPTLQEQDYEAVGLENPKDILVFTDKKGMSQTIALGKSDGKITYVRVGEKQEVVGLYTADIDLSRLTGDTLVYVAPLKAPVSQVKSISIKGETSDIFELDQKTGMVTRNGKVTDAKQFEKIFYKYVSLIASGGEKEVIQPTTEPILTCTSIYTNKKKMVLELYEKDEHSYYMGINGEVQFYLDKEKVTELIERITG